jgi:hypothetical protein
MDEYPLAETSTAVARETRETRDTTRTAVNLKRKATLKRDPKILRKTI